MLRCASFLVIAAYAEVRLIPQDSRALPAAFLRSLPIFTFFKTFYRVIILASSADPSPLKNRRKKRAVRRHTV
jgi:hypothetical protein